VKKILTVSDEVDPLVYSPAIKERYSDVDLVISCGDLSFLYLEYIITTLNADLFFVHGNHDPDQELTEGEPRSYPLGGKNLHCRSLNHQGLLLGGIEGSIQYNKEGSYQYTQADYWGLVLRLIPQLLINKLIRGRFLDIFVTHSPPAGVHDRSDFAHQGIKAFRWLINTFQPAYHIHGHIHLYRPNEVWDSDVGNTRVINAYKSRLVEFPPSEKRSAADQ
jgi:Icc-related predicted phosphoesterase